MIKINPITQSMEILEFTYETSEAIFNQPVFKKMWSDDDTSQTLISTQLLFVTKNKDDNLCSADLNSFTFHKIVQGLGKFGTPFDIQGTDLIQEKKDKTKDVFFIRFNEKLGARFDDNILSSYFGKKKENQIILSEICKKHTFPQTNLEIFVIVQQRESNVVCFIFGRNGENKRKRLTKSQIHHFLLSLYAFTDL